MKKIIISIFIILILLSVSGGYIFNEIFLKRPIKSSIPQDIKIEEGEGLREVARKLEEKNIIANKFLFLAYARLLGLDVLLQAGDYHFRPGSSVAKVLQELTKINIDEDVITIIEGWNLREIANYLKNKGVINNEQELYSLTGEPARDYKKGEIPYIAKWDYLFLSDKPSNAGLEGYIYPDTYKILRGASPDVLIKKALDNFDRKLTPKLREEVARKEKTIYEILIKASIVEKEANTYNDRRIVADIINRRLKRGMALQMDSTINYITASGRARSTYKDIEIDSTWNTYKYAGLPKGPINNPSILSINAVLYPQANDYLYFLTGKDGAMYYAKTYNEHLENRKYLD